MKDVKNQNLVTVPDVNIEVYPELDQDHQVDDGVELTIGDLHGSALKLLYFLRRHGVVDISEDNYKKFVRIYNLPISHLGTEELNNFDNLIERITINEKAKNALIRLIGDVVADRGSNDYFTLKLLEKLKQAKIPVEILLSNHDMAGLTVYYDSDLKILSARDQPREHYYPYKTLLTKNNQDDSLQNLGWLIHKKTITSETAKNLFGQNLILNLKLISYSIDRSGAKPRITLYSHAPVPFSIIKILARQLKIKYRASSVDKLAQTIDAINSEFQKNPDHLIDALEYIDNMPKDEAFLYGWHPEDNPIAFSTWKRGYTYKKRGSRKDLDFRAEHAGFEIHYVHGHHSSLDANDKTRIDNRGRKEKLTINTITNLDNELGKGDQRPDEYKITYNTGCQFAQQAAAKPKQQAEQTAKENVEEDNVNIDEYPKLDADHQAADGVHITIGDLHGNALKLLYFLTRHGFITISKDDYEAFRDIYLKDELAQDDIDQFRDLLTRIQVNDNARGALVRLIGDVVADRGQNDYFTLKLLEKLDQGNVLTEILSSNHDIEALPLYDEKFKIQNEKSYPYETTLTDVRNKQDESLQNLGKLIRDGILTQEEVTELFRKHHLSHLRLLSYEIDTTGEKPKIALYSHAPIPFSIIKELAKELDIECNDESVYELAETIDAINLAAQHFTATELYKQAEPTHHDLFSGTAWHPSTRPIEFLTWKRGYKYIPEGANRDELLDYPTEHNGYQIHYAHGHTGGGEIELGIKNTIPTLSNYDNSLGKNKELHTGKYTVEFSAGWQGAKQFEFKLEESAEQAATKRKDNQRSNADYVKIKEQLNQSFRRLDYDKIGKLDDAFAKLTTDVAQSVLDVIDIDPAGSERQLTQKFTDLAYQVTKGLTILDGQHIVLNNPLQILRRAKTSLKDIIIKEGPDSEISKAIKKGNDLFCLEQVINYIKPELNKLIIKGKELTPRQQQVNKNLRSIITFLNESHEKVDGTPAFWRNLYTQLYVALLEAQSSAEETFYSWHLAKALKTSLSELELAGKDIPNVAEGIKSAKEGDIAKLDQKVKENAQKAPTFLGSASSFFGMKQGMSKLNEQLPKKKKVEKAEEVKEESATHKALSHFGLLSEEKRKDAEAEELNSPDRELKFNK